jgi:hypothetical protein
MIHCDYRQTFFQLGAAMVESVNWLVWLLRTVVKIMQFKINWRRSQRVQTDQSMNYVSFSYVKYMYVLYSFIYLFTYSFIYLFMYLFIYYLFMYSFIYLFTYVSYSCFHLFIYLFIHLFIYLLIQVVRVINNKWKREFSR